MHARGPSKVIRLGQLQQFGVVITNGDAGDLRKEVEHSVAIRVDDPIANALVIVFARAYSQWANGCKRKRRTTTIEPVMKKWDRGSWNRPMDVDSSFERGPGMTSVRMSGALGCSAGKTVDEATVPWAPRQATGRGTLRRAERIILEGEPNGR